MASYDELQFLDDIDDLIDVVYDVEGYGEVRKAYDELSGYDVYRQWIEPDLVEKALSPAQLRQRRDAAKSRARAAGANGGIADRFRAGHGYASARHLQVRAAMLGPVRGHGRYGSGFARLPKQTGVFLNPVRNKAFNNQMRAQGMQLRGGKGMAIIGFDSKQARSKARRRSMKSLALQAAVVGGAMAAGEGLRRSANNRLMDRMNAADEAVGAPPTYPRRKSQVDDRMANPRKLKFKKSDTVEKGWKRRAAIGAAVGAAAVGGGMAAKGMFGRKPAGLPSGGHRYGVNDPHVAPTGPAAGPTKRRRPGFPPRLKSTRGYKWVNRRG
jgi:hypothetical protein